MAYVQYLLPDAKEFFELDTRGKRAVEVRAIVEKHLGDETERVCKGVRTAMEKGMRCTPGTWMEVCKMTH